MRIKLTLAYDGGSFRGWQSQAGGGTVQDVLERALAEVAGRAVRVHGAGRTDAGVHALAQCAHFDQPPGLRLQPRQWLAALNANLPTQVRILRATKAKPDFHARFDARGKHYRYRICNLPVLPPLEAGRAWHVPAALDRARLAAAAACFQGRHDFAAFSARRSKADGNTVRTVFRARAVFRSAGMITLDFEGEGFLYKMVRMMAAAAVRVAAGKEELPWIARCLADPGAERSHHVAPAAGLYLVNVRY